MVAYHPKEGTGKIKSIFGKKFWFYIAKSDFVLFSNVSIWYGINDHVPIVFSKNVVES